MEPTDQDLLAATAAGDGEAFAVFWRRHTTIVMAFGIHRCATSEDVADLVADTFLAAFRAAGRYRAVLRTISARDRKVLELVAYAQLSPSEAALALGISPNAARLRLARARKRLRERLQPTDPPAGLAVPNTEVPSHDR